MTEKHGRHLLRGQSAEVHSASTCGQRVPTSGAQRPGPDLDARRIVLSQICLCGSIVAEYVVRSGPVCNRVFLVIDRAAPEFDTIGIEFAMRPEFQLDRVRVGLIPGGDVNAGVVRSYGADIVVVRPSKLPCPEFPARRIVASNKGVART